MALEGLLFYEGRQRWADLGKSGGGRSGEGREGKLQTECNIREKNKTKNKVFKIHIVSGNKDYIAIGKST